MLLTWVLVFLLSGASTDDGIGIDPHGGIRAARCGDEGSGLDPHGRPCTTALNSVDRGSEMDPNG